MSEYVVAVDELRALACAVALDEDLDLVVGKRGSGWFINPETGLVNVDEADLLDQTAEDVRGLTCHEAAHAAVTRYLDLVPKRLMKRPGIPSLLNSLEDCRIEEWICTRYPGAARWVEIYNDRLFPRDGAGLDQQPWFRQFCLGAIHEWWYGELPPTLHDEPRAALEATREAREAVVAAQPPVDARIDVGAALAYERHPVAEVYRGHDRFHPPDAFERLVRTSAYASWRRVWRDVVPVYEDLWRRDTEHVARMKEHEADFLRQIRELRFGSPPKGARRRGIRLPPGMVLPGMPMVPASELDEIVDLDRLPELEASLRDALERAANQPPKNEYESARRDVAGLIDRLVDELDRLLRPASYPRWVSGYPSGNRVDLRMAMRVEAEPGAYARLWDRKTLPHKRDPGFLLLLDLSGSMTGECIRHGFRGTVLLSEVLARLGIPFAVYGFQDVIIPFKRFDQPLDHGTRVRMGSMPAEVSGNRRGGHNHPEHNWDGPVLERAAEALLDWPGAQRFLIVVSDGEPSGPSNAEKALHRAVARVRADGIHLVGLGLGPGTEHVARYYPDHLANLPLDAFPASLGALVERVLLSEAGLVRRSR